MNIACLGTLARKQVQSNWLSGFSYRKSFTYSRASGAVENYQVKILVGESSGATGEDVDCGGHCLATFADLRFTKSDGTTELKYYIEGISGTTPNCLATVWVKLNSVGTSATTFYMYYGDADATTTSSVDDTADEYEGFESGTVGLFDNEFNRGDYFSISTTQKRGSYSLKWNDTAGSAGGGRYSSDGTFWSESTKRVSCWVYNDTNTQFDIYLSSGSVLKVATYTLGEGSVYAWDGSFFDTLIDITQDAWFKYEFILDSSTYSLYIYNASLSLVGSSTGISYGSLSVTYRDVLFGGGKNPTGIVYFDDVMSMKYSNPEPALGSWGSEES